MARQPWIPPDYSLPQPQPQPQAAPQQTSVYRPDTWESGMLPSGYNEAQVLAAANNYASSLPGYSPGMITHEGQLEYRNGVPGVNIKYRTGTGSSTEWTPLSDVGQFAGASVGGGAGGLAGGLASGGINNPLFAQLQADLRAQGVSDIASRDAGVRRGIIEFGEAPDFGDALGSLGFDPRPLIDEKTRALALQNTEAGLSTKARIDKANKDTLRQIRNVLASRGLLRSGELGHQLKEQTLRYTQNQFDSRRQLLDYLAGVQRAFADSERQRQMALFQGMLNQPFRGGGGGFGGGPAPSTVTEPVPQGPRPELGYIDPRGGNAPNGDPLLLFRRPQGGGQIL